MPLSPASINAIIQPQAATGKIVLQSSVFDDEATIKAALARDFFNTHGKITIDTVTSYTFDQAAGTITFAGLGSGGPFDLMTIPQVQIKVDNSDPANPLPQLSIEAIPPASWKLNNSFPGLTSDVVKVIGFTATNNPEEAKSPRIFWANYTSETDNTQVDFFFQGIMDLVPPYDILDLFMGDAEKWISGSLRMVGATNTTTGYADYQPAGSLRADVNSAQVSLGPLQINNVQLALEMSPVYNENEMVFQTNSNFSISSHLIFMGGAIILSVKFQDMESPMLFTTTMPGAFQAGISDLAKLVFGSTSNQTLSIPGFNLSDPNAITLQDISFSYTPSGPGKGLNSISVDMGTPPNEDWEIWSGVHLKNIVVTFQVIPGPAPTFSGSFAGIVDDWLSINAAFTYSDTGTDYSFYGGLAQPVTISQLVTFFSGQTIAGLPDLQVSVLYVAVTKTSDGFGFEGDLEIDGTWTLLSSPITIELRGLLFHLQRTPSSGGQSTNDVKAGGMLDIGDYQFSLKADYSSTDGWQFAGNMIFIGTDEKATTFGNALKNYFGITTELPGIIDDWYIQNIDVAYNSGKGDFTFTCDLGNTDYPQLSLEFVFQLTKSAEAYSMDFTGTLTYVASTGNMTLVFELIIHVESTTNPSSKTTTVTASYNATGTPPSLKDFLVAVSKDLGLDSELPGELAIDAALISMKWIFEKKDSDPMRIDLAALFDITIDSLKWEIYLSYTNDAYFESQGPNSRAMSPSNTPAYILGVALSGDVGLEKLPLVGKIPGIGDLYIKELGFYYTNAAFSATLKKLIFTVAKLGTNTPLAPDPNTAFLSQPSFTVMALFGNKNEDKSKPNSLPLPVYTQPTSGSGNPPSFQQNQSLPQQPISWLEINKTLGPVELIKIGFGYEKPAAGVTDELGVAGLYVTGAFTVAGLSMVLDRLGVTFPIPKPGSGLNPLSKIGFHLGGMFLEYQTPSFEIAGGFINLPGGSVNMIGEFIIKFGTFGLQAYGGYSDELSSPSLFIFLHLNAPLGGPPFFFITGVSGGFGVNRGFKLPTFDQLATYPLLPSSPAIPSSGDLAGKSSEDKLKAMTDALVSLANYFPVEEGEYWFAVGLDVTCFEMISVSAILSIAFGVNLEIGVVGSASMTIPVEEPEPIVFIQINFEISYSSDSGMLAVMGAITPSSFIYAGLVHISGGFAFYTWFSGEHSGDFVLTIGGYNAHYKRPDFYPDVPRMEMRAGFGPVNMVGDAYFALLPHMLMAGMDIKATADLGPISAWFDASLDFIFGWKPFHYEITASVEIGASFTIELGFVKVKITIQVGVWLDVWGPEFGGKATVDLDIITFTINFGADPKPAPLLDWSAFKQFLPSVKGDKTAPNTNARMMLAAELDTTTNPPLVNIMVKTGLQQQFEEGHEVDGLNWIVNANGFDIRTHSAAPVTKLNYNGTDLPATTYQFLSPDNLMEDVEKAISNNVPQPYFAYKDPEPETPWFELNYGIPPMGLTNIKSTHIVNFHHIDEQGNIGKAVTDVIITLNTTGVPPSLWGNEPVTTGSVNSSQTVIQNSLVELSITPMIWFPKRTTFIPYYYLVFDTNNLFLEQDTAPLIKAPDYTEQQTKTIYLNMENGTAFSSTQTVRSQIVDTLMGAGFGNLKLINSDHLSTQDYVDDPTLIYMSSTNETRFN